MLSVRLAKRLQLIATRTTQEVATASTMDQRPITPDRLVDPYFGSARKLVLRFGSSHVVNTKFSPITRTIGSRATTKLGSSAVSLGIAAGAVASIAILAMSFPLKSVPGSQSRCAP